MKKYFISLPLFVIYFTASAQVNRPEKEVNDTVKTRPTSVKTNATTPKTSQGQTIFSQPVKTTNSNATTLVGQTNSILSKDAVVGYWKGINIDGEQIHFELKKDGKIVVKGLDYLSRDFAFTGNFTFSNNTISGSYPGPVYYGASAKTTFTGTIDATAQQMNCNYKITVVNDRLVDELNIKEQGTWTVYKTKEAPVYQTYTAPPPAEPVYFLTAAKVKIYTGNDNKEFPSDVIIRLVRLDAPNSMYFERDGADYRREFQINSVNEFGLETSFSPTGYKPWELMLSEINKYGLQLQIKYYPNLFTDAWRIEKVELLLEFKDQYGKLHPQMGNKIITFDRATKTLTDGDRILICDTDKFLFPVLQ